MALKQNTSKGMPLKQRGQGAAEAIVALPAFLILLSLVFQLFLLGIAQARLQYAAYCAARTGSVHGGDDKVMERAAARALALSPGLSAFPGRSLLLKVSKNWEGDRHPDTIPGDEVLTVHLYWKYPLKVPLIDALASRLYELPSGGHPSVRLKASWTTIFSEGPFGREENENQPQTR